MARVDIKVNDISLFESSAYTSQYQSGRNDWLEKKVEPFNDQILVEKDWVFGCGHINGDNKIIKAGLFDGIYRYQDDLQFQYQFLQRIVATQSFLKQQDIPYVFMFYKNFIRDLQKSTTLYNIVDWNNCFTEHNLYDIATDIGSFDKDGIHPGIDANRVWAQKLDKFIKERI